MSVHYQVLSKRLTNMFSLVPAFVWLYVEKTANPTKKAD